MGTPVSTVYRYFLSRIESDSWLEQDDIDIYEQDWRDILEMSRFFFRYPRKNINIDAADEFIDDLTNDEIQVLAILMKQEWLKRCVASTDNLRQGYDERDWKQGSRANHLDRLIKYQETTEREARRALNLYSRSEEYKPSPIFSQLAGDGDNATGSRGRVQE